jgi:hypothetical protein
LAKAEAILPAPRKPIADWEDMRGFLAVVLSERKLKPWRFSPARGAMLSPALHRQPGSFEKRRAGTGLPVSFQRPFAMGNEGVKAISISMGS